MIFCAALIMGGCTRNGSSPAAGQTATVTLKDGGSFSGAVTKSDNSAITLASANGETRTYPMTQVDSVQYVPATAPGGLPLAGAPGGPPTPKQPVQETRTLPANTTIVVRNSDRIRAGSAQTGQTYPGVIVRDVVGSDGAVVIP